MGTPFPIQSLNWSSPAVRAATVTPSDVTSFAVDTRAIYVGGTGDVTVLMGGGDTVTFKAVPVGVTLNISATRVNSTNTTATLMVALW